MKNLLDKSINKYRLTDEFITNYFGSIGNENVGAFLVPYNKIKLFVVASNKLGWDHLSISLKTRCPKWEEMCFIKNIFFEEEDCVLQYHPPKSQYINNCEFCLHLWRPHNIEILMPPSAMIGI